MTGGVKFLLAQMLKRRTGRADNCGCGASLEGMRSNALSCSDRCRKIKNGQTKGD